MELLITWDHYKEDIIQHLLNIKVIGMNLMIVLYPKLVIKPQFPVLLIYYSIKDNHDVLKKCYIFLLPFLSNYKIFYYYFSFIATFKLMKYMLFI